MRDLDVTELTETVDEGIQEHHVVKVLMREIADLSDPVHRILAIGGW